METRKKIEALIILISMLMVGAFLLASNHSEKDERPDRSDRMMPTGEMDIVETAAAAGKFETFITLLEAAGMVDALKGEGPFTVFAPTDRAFAKLPEGVLDKLLMVENKEKLISVLRHHVAGKIIMLRGRRFKSLSDTRLVINNLGEVMVNDAMIVARNIPASNGVIHAVDTLLLPDENEHERTALRIINEAIELGGPLYNCGNLKACAVVYRSALSNLMGMPNGTFSEESRRWITRMFIAAPEMADPREKSWAFRSVMDDILAELQHGEEMAMD